MTKLRTSLLLRFAKRYDSIDNLPMYNWKKIHDTGEHKWLFKAKVEIEGNEELAKSWANIYDEYLAEFGISKQFEEILNKKKQIAILKADYITKNDRVLLNFISVEENALESLYGTSEQGTSFRESLVHLEKMQGIKINTRKITVADYYNYLRSIKNDG